MFIYQNIISNFIVHYYFTKLNVHYQLIASSSHQGFPFLPWISSQHYLHNKQHLLCSVFIVDFLKDNSPMSTQELSSYTPRRGLKKISSHVLTYTSCQHA